jgi:hypothetical protein
MYKILAFIIVIIIIFGLNYWCHLIGTDFYKDHPTDYTIHDLLHSVLPDLHDYHIIIDIIGIIVIIPAFLYFNQELTIEFLTKFLIIMLIRAFTIVSTVLPKFERCDTTFDIRNFLLGGCYDKIFSGHTAFTLLIVLVAYNFNLLDNNKLLILGIFQLIYAFLIIITRAHYSVDVLLSYYIVIPLYLCIKQYKSFN